MAIHAPAHRPPVHFHVTWPHLGDAAQGIVSALVVIALIVAVGAVATVVSTPSRDAAARAEAQSLVLFRAGEREPSTAEARSAAAFRAGERAPLFSEAEGLVLFRAGEREPAVSEAESLVLFRAGERLSR